MIHHASIGVRDVDMCAPVVAKLLNGRAGRLPTHDETAMITVGDGHGTALELWPMDSRFTPNMDEAFVKVDKRELEEARTAFHLFISTPRTPAEIFEIAKEAGWPAVERKLGAPFRLIEVWVEGHTMLEVCPEEWLPLYLKAASGGFSQP